MPVAVSVSVGVATDGGPHGPITGEELLRRADAAMYAAKTQGKARWVVHGAPALEQAAWSADEQPGSALQPDPASPPERAHPADTASQPDPLPPQRGPPTTAAPSSPTAPPPAARPDAPGVDGPYGAG